MGRNQNTVNNQNVLLTGGHGATTGIAVIEALKKRRPDIIISWIGSKEAIPGQSVTSLEYKVYPSLGIKYYSIIAGKLQTKFTLYTIPLMLMIPVGFVQAFFLLLKIKPRVILSLGGYSSFPVVVSGWLLNIPIVLHEQTVVAGRSSMASAFFAKKIALGREESLKYFPREKSVLTGNPITSDILKIKPKTKPGNPKTILIMGGSRGSQFINAEVSKVIKDLIAKYKVIHITGERDYEKYKGLASINYKLFSFVDPADMAKLYGESDIIISRAGANTISEILSVKRPAILIPLPRTFMSEQVKNANYVAKYGLAIVMLESEVNQKTLLDGVHELFMNWKEMVDKSDNMTVLDLSASDAVASLVTEYLTI